MNRSLLLCCIVLLSGCGVGTNADLIEGKHKSSPALQTPPPDYMVDPDRTDPSALGATKTVFLGDSITRLGDWSLWFPGVDTSNQGVGGNTIDMVAARLAPITASHPARIFLAIGTNDLNMGHSLGGIAAAYNDLVVRIRTESPGTKLYCMSVLPVGHLFPSYFPMAFSPADTVNVNVAIQQAAQANGATYIDTWSAFAGPDTWAKDGLTSGSALHLSKEGYATLVDVIGPYVFATPN